MPEWKLIWIEKLLVSDEIRHKIEIKHGIDVDWLIEVLENNPRIYAAIFQDSRHGNRLKVKLELEINTFLYIYFSPIQKSHGEYKLITAFKTRKLSKWRG